MKKTIICLLLTLTIISCSTDHKHVNSTGIDESVANVATDSFKYEDLCVKYLNNWSITENIMESGSRIIIWERKGKESSGQFIVTKMKSGFTLESVLDIAKSNLCESYAIPKSILKESTLKKREYLGVPAIDQNSEFEFNGDKVFWKFLVFRKNRNTFCLLFQSNGSDKELNSTGFDYFEKNLKIDVR